MDRELVVAAIERSLAGPRETDVAPVKPTGLADQLLRDFSARRIEPRQCNVLSQSSAAPGELTVFLLTDGDPQSVFYDPATDHFGVAWGPDAETGTYIDEGFRSPDVLYAQFLSE